MYCLSSTLFMMNYETAIRAIVPCLGIKFWYEDFIISLRLWIDTGSLLSIFNDTIIKALLIKENQQEITKIASNKFNLLNKVRELLNYFYKFIWLPKATIYLCQQRIPRVLVINRPVILLYTNYMNITSKIINYFSYCI